KASDTFRFVTSAPSPQPQENFADAIIQNTRARYSRAPVTPSPEPGEPAPPPPVETEAPFSILKLERPAPAVPKQFRTTHDRILYYLNVAEYLSTKQIIMLCYSHLSKPS